ncbi:MAG: S9 family peptidase [Chlorobiota bacterium]|nr:MAG: S9 family peptidase [Chlorobiota bacterium]
MKTNIIELKNFFKNPESNGYAISPNGEYISFLKPINGRMNIHLQKIGSNDVKPLTNVTVRDILFSVWKGNNTIVYFMDLNGDENFHFYTINIENGVITDATPFNEVQAYPVDFFKENDEEIIIQMNKENPELMDLYKLNVISNELKIIGKNPGGVTEWLTDHEGVARLAIQTNGLNKTLLYRENDVSEFKEMFTFDFKDAFHPLTFDSDNKHFFASTNFGKDKKRIIKYNPEYNLETNLKSIVLFENDEYDSENVMYSTFKKKLTGFYYNSWKTEYVFIDDERKNLQVEIDSLFPNYDVSIRTTSTDETKMLLLVNSDRFRGAYYFYNSITKELFKLATIAPWLNENELSEMKPIQYISRDGLTIHGYLTLPIGQDTKNLPVVIHPHGGPHARDFYGYNSDTQFLANRGYAVLQMNFRGSTGYGKHFETIAYKQWGKTMQDDITDGVNWLIQKGIADPKRVGIYGASYGGYAVLAGLCFTPDVYKCGIDYVGCANLFTIIESIPPYWKPELEMTYQQIGHPIDDADLLRSISPVFHADKIVAPLLIAQGTNDPRVKKAESDQMVEAMRKRGVEVQYIVKENEGHGFHNEENKFEFYSEMEKFLNQHLS